MGIFCFIRTPLIAGDTNVPNFLLPLLDVDSVGESLANSAYSGYGSTIYMPGIFGRLAVTLVSSFGESLRLSSYSPAQSGHGLIATIQRLIILFLPTSERWS